MASLVFAWPEAPNRNGMKHRLKAILEETKLEHLMPLFADQAVKDDIINYLDDSDLEKLGINKLGDRKRLLLAFARPSEFTADGTVLLEVPGGNLPGDSAFAGVRVSSFEIGKYPVLVEEWEWVRTWGLAHGYEIDAATSAPNRTSVAQVNWGDTLKWCNAKSEHEGFLPVYSAKGETLRHWVHGSVEPFEISMNAKGNGYRLPTHIEWEWTARGGPLSQKNHSTKTASAPNTTAVIEEGQATEEHPFCQSGAELGVHLMSDTDWEWCWDAEGSGTPHRIRGGCRKHLKGNSPYPYFCFSCTPENPHGLIWFRLARNV